ncbi:MAG: tetratricopeptide repeat protein [Nitrospiraceae bacterium]|nr:tetratricopeptide repeat protein [Nitrospiraceae bacterium]
MGRSISVAMIVRDEAGQIAQCLDALAGLADEVCVVDTGSTDDTIAIVRRHGAKVDFFPWCGDFSAARNISLDGCTGDWILVLDADERIAPKDRAEICALARGPLDRCYRFTTRNYTNTDAVSEFHPCAPSDPHARGFAGWYPSVKVRMFPRGAGARFEGRVHEVVNRSLEAAGVRVVPCSVPIHHYPYLKSADRVLAKQQMYLELGLKKVAEHPDDANAHAELGNQYADLGDYASAAAAYREALRRDPSNAVVAKDLGGVLYLLDRRAEAEQALGIALRLDPSLVEGWRNLGVIHVAQERWAEAVACFERALAIDPASPDGYRYLAVALQGAGRLTDAADAAAKALAAQPVSAAAVHLYAELVGTLGRFQEGRDLLTAKLSGSDFPRAELCHALGELWFREGRSIEARNCFEECLALQPGHGNARTRLSEMESPTPPG